MGEKTDEKDERGRGGGERGRERGEGGSGEGGNFFFGKDDLLEHKGGKFQRAKYK